MSRMSGSRQSEKTSKKELMCVFYIYILDACYYHFIIVLNTIINNSRHCVFNLTRTGNNEFIIVGLYGYIAMHR